MLIVLSHANDAGAHQLVERWRDHDARLMVARDVCAPGWRHHVATTGDDVAVAGGSAFPAAQITGVITRVPCVYPAELPHIVESDRAYVAAEATAFLIAWLHGLRCPVVNPPSAGSLSGPVLSHERWVMKAARAGLKLASPRYCVPGVTWPAPAACATVVAGRWFGNVAPELGNQAVRLARLAGVDLLSVRFDAARGDARFVAADLAIDITPAIADAVLERLHTRPVIAEACA